MVEAVTKFQVVNDLSNTGNLASVTWKTLFSNDALSMVSESQYPQVLADYEERKAAEAEATKVMGALELTATSKAGKSTSGKTSKSYMQISWSASLASDLDESTDAAVDEAIVTVVDSEAPSDDGTASYLINSYIDGYQVYKSTSKTTGFKKAFTTDNTSYKNTTGLVKGTRYYYKVRAYKQVGSKSIYSSWSNVTYKVAK
jgi:hypothetical protein